MLSWVVLFSLPAVLPSPMDLKESQKSVPPALAVAVYGVLHVKVQAKCLGSL
jgi:hypothetical protein